MVKADLNRSVSPSSTKGSNNTELPRRINYAQRVTFHVGVAIDTPSESDWVALDVPAQSRVVLPVPVLEQSRLRIKYLAS